MNTALENKQFETVQAERMNSHDYLGYLKSDNNPNQNLIQNKSINRVNYYAISYSKSNSEVFRSEFGKTDFGIGLRTSKNIK